MWISNDMIEPGVSGASDGEMLYLTNRTNLPLMYRKLVDALLVAPVFQLTGSAWIEQHVGPDSIFAPAPNSSQFEQWCPRIHRTLEPPKHTWSQREKVAALGILIIELEIDRKAEWTKDDKDYMEAAKYKGPVFLITGLKIAWGATISNEHGRVIEHSAEANVIVPAGPLDLRVGASSRLASESGITSAFRKRTSYSGSRYRSFITSGSISAVIVS
jgi:hypothetical protein